MQNPARTPPVQVQILQDNTDNFITACNNCNVGVGGTTDQVKLSGYEGDASTWFPIADPGYPGLLSFKNKSTGKLLSMCSGCYAGGFQFTVAAHLDVSCLDAYCWEGRWSVVEI